MRVAISLVLVLMSGCFWATTKHEGQELRKDVDRIDGDVKSQKDTLGEKVRELEKVLGQATKLLSRNSADLGAKVDTLGRENAEIVGKINTAERLAKEVADELKALRADQAEKLDALEKRIVAIELRATEQPPKTAADLFAEARKAFEAKQYADARALFRKLVVAYPEGEEAAEAQYYRGETYFREANYKSAIGEFQKTFDKYPKSRRADEALYRAGESAEKLKWCTDARAYFGVLMQRYPKSSLVKRARNKARLLKAASSNKRKCQS